MSQYREHFLAKSALYEWKIENFLDREKNETVLKSPEFLIYDVQYFIRINPRLVKNEKLYRALLKNVIPIFLYKASSITDHRIVFSLGVKRADGSVLVSTHPKVLFGNQEKGYGSCFSRSKLISDKEHVFGPDGTLTVFCEVHETDNSSVVAETQTSLADTFGKISEDFENIYMSGCQTDVVMDVRGEKFSGHRLVLSARSSVFRSMIELDMKEKETGVINIIDCDPQSFGAFLLFLYSAKLDVVTSDNALGLYATADKYNVQDLKKECCECLARELSVDSICDVLHVATLYEEQELLKHAKAYFIKNANEILTTVKWHSFLKENLTVANELFIEALNKKVDP